MGMSLLKTDGGNLSSTCMSLFSTVVVEDCPIVLNICCAHSQFVCCVLSNTLNSDLAIHCSVFPLRQNLNSENVLRHVVIQPGGSVTDSVASRVETETEVQQAVPLLRNLGNLRELGSLR